MQEISLEDTNKIRLSLSFKPLIDNAGSANDSGEIAEANYVRQRTAENKDRESKKIVERIAKVRNQQELNAKLGGPTLGDAGELEDTLQWIKKTKHEQPAKRRQEEFQNIDNAMQGEYTEKDLVGLKVSHDFDEMKEGDAKVLILKDGRILDDEDDELQNIEMAEDDRTRKYNDLKTKSRAYTGYDDDEFLAPGTARSVLAKYDEDIDGVGQTVFRLCGGGIAGKIDRALLESGVAVNTPPMQIDYVKSIKTTDYSQEVDAGFKKPQVKKRALRRAQAEADPDISDTTMAIDGKPIAPYVRDLDSNFVDDDELQVALARSRQAKIPKIRKMTFQEIAAKVAAERARDEAAQETIMTKDDDTIIIDDTSEFVRAIGPIGASVRKPRDILMGPAKVMEDIEAGEIMAEVEGRNEDEGAIEATKEVELGGSNFQNIGTSSQQTHGSGVASTLNILRQQGILTTPTTDHTAREQAQLQHDLWLAEQRRRLAQREMDKLQGRGQNKDQATREYENRMREQQEARDSLEAFKNYKPTIELTEYDEFGRAMTRKESWKALSHKFHGKGSGKMKLEKRLKKIADEKKREAMVCRQYNVGQE